MASESDEVSGERAFGRLETKVDILVEEAHANRLWREGHVVAHAEARGAARRTVAIVAAAFTGIGAAGSALASVILPILKSSH